MSIPDRIAVQFARLTEELPDWATDPSLIVGLLGVVLLLAGRRMYRLAIVAPGLAAGAMLGLDLTQEQEPLTRALVSAAMAIIAAFALHSVERLAVAAAGAFVTVGLARAVTPHLMDGETPWYVLVAAGIVGLLLFPRLYQRLLLVLTPAVGALCIAWASGRPEDLVMIGGLTLLGVVIQLAMGADSK